MWLGDVDVGVVERAVAAVDQQLAQRPHAGRVGVSARSSNTEISSRSARTALALDAVVHMGNSVLAFKDPGAPQRDLLGSEPLE